MGATALILALPEDVHARSVAKELSARGVRPLVLDTADYPRSWSLSHWIEPSGSRYLLRHKGGVLATEDLCGVWWRRPRAHEVSDEIVDDEIRRFCGQEARAAFRGWLISLGRRVINPPAEEAAAAYKPFQLATAARLGLDIPRTCVTNEPADARAFMRGLGKPAVFKILTGTAWQFAETREFKPEHEAHLPALRHAPAIFQQLVPGLDLRVTVVDGRAFAVAIRPRNPGARLDWRLDASAAYEPHELDASVAERLVRLVSALGLRYGAVDLRLSEEGRHVFLEVNPSGQFLFCDIHAGQAISAALAEALANS
jgi:MvdD pre-ATP grasp domain